MCAKWRDLGKQRGCGLRRHHQPTPEENRPGPKSPARTHSCPARVRPAQQGNFARLSSTQRPPAFLPHPATPVNTANPPCRFSAAQDLSACLTPPLQMHAKSPPASFQPIFQESYPHKIPELIAHYAALTGAVGGLPIYSSNFRYCMQRARPMRKVARLAESSGVAGEISCRFGRHHWRAALHSSHRLCKCTPSRPQRLALRPSKNALSTPFQPFFRKVIHKKFLN